MDTTPNKETLAEIVESVKDGERPDYEDLRYSVIALSALHNFAFQTILTLSKKEIEGRLKPDGKIVQYYAEERFKGFKAALNKPPKEYVGASHDPDTQECQEWRKLSKNILKKVASKNEEKQ